MKHAEVVIARRAVEEGRGLVVIVNKMDLLRGKENSKLYEKVIKAVPEEIQTVIPQVDTAGWLQRTKQEKGPASLSVMQSRKSLMRAHVIALVLDAEEVKPDKKKKGDPVHEAPANAGSGEGKILQKEEVA